MDFRYRYFQIFSNFIKYIRIDNKRGVSVARNVGIKNSLAPWVAFLDSDDYWLSKKLKIQMEFIYNNPKTIACQTEEVWIRNGRRVNPKLKHKKPSGDIFYQSLKLCLVSPSSVAIKRSVFDEVGFFDESLPVAEDYDLWLRISCRYPIYLINKDLIIKEGGHDDQLSQKFQGMDKFRIRAIVRLIKSGVLSLDQRAGAIEELTNKCNIYGNGCMKRGKKEEGTFYLSMPERIARRE